MINLDFQPKIWRRALDLPTGDESFVLTMEGPRWWEITTEYLSYYLSNVRKFVFSGIFIVSGKGDPSCTVGFTQLLGQLNQHIYSLQWGCR